MSSDIKPTDVQQFLEDLDGGVFLNKVAHALSEAAAGVVATEGKKGGVTLTFSMERIGGSQQVRVDHKIAYVVPHRHGKYGDEDTTQTPLYVNDGGKLTVFMEGHGQLFGKKGEPEPHTP